MQKRQLISKSIFGLMEWYTISLTPGSDSYLLLYEVKNKF